VAVTNISGVPTSGTVGTPITLSGTVEPSNATSKTIVWSVKSVGTTGAAKSGDTLSTTSAGTVTVTATIANGKAPGTPYTQDFNIVITGGSYSLVGTIWKAEAEDKAKVEGIERTAKLTSTLIFTSASNWVMGSKMVITETGEERRDTDRGTYTTSGNTIVLYVVGIQPDGISGVINGDTIVIYALADEGTDLTFTRQSSSANTSITGTTWEAEYEDIREAGGTSDGETYEIRRKITYTLKFTTDSAFTMDLKMVSSDTDKDESDSVNGTYTVYGNDVVLAFDKNMGTSIGAINGDTIILYTNADIVFIKQLRDDGGSSR